MTRRCPARPYSHRDPWQSRASQHRHRPCPLHPTTPTRRPVARSCRVQPRAPRPDPRTPDRWPRPSSQCPRRHRLFHPTTPQDFPRLEAVKFRLNQSLNQTTRSCRVQPPAPHPDPRPPVPSPRPSPRRRPRPNQRMGPNPQRQSTLPDLPQPPPP